MKIGIIAGSIRDGHKSADVAQWVAEHGAERGEATFEVINLKEFNVPLLTSETLPMMANRTYDSPEVQAWSEAIDACDAYIFVTPEYNHGVPGGFKNAVDSLGPEFQHKVVGFVSYGADNGVRAVEHWRQVTANFSMRDVRAQVSLNLFAEFGKDGTFTPEDRRKAEVKALLDQVVAAASA